MITKNPVHTFTMEPFPVGHTVSLQMEFSDSVQVIHITDTHGSQWKQITQKKFMCKVLYSTPNTVSVTTDVECGMGAYFWDEDAKSES